MQNAINTDDLPWIPLRPGVAFKALRFFPDDAGWVQLLRVDPGVTIALHRHTGEVHAWHLQGARKLHTGEVVGAGAYVYEAPGNADWWTSVGPEPLIVHVVVYGAVEYLDGNGAVTSRVTASTLRALT
jgi:quercetin dioxygenase-like cupin family protein